MKIGSLTSTKLNRWQAGIAWGKAPAWQQQGYWFIHIWFIKLETLPPMGEMIRPEHYRGLRLYRQFDLHKLFTA